MDSLQESLVLKQRSEYLFPIYAGLIVGPVAGLTLIAGNVGVILGLFPAHVTWTVYTVAKYIFNSISHILLQNLFLNENTSINKWSFCVFFFSKFQDKPI